MPRIIAGKLRRWWHRRWGNIAYFSIVTPLMLLSALLVVILGYTGLAMLAHRVH